MQSPPPCQGPPCLPFAPSPTCPRPSFAFIYSFMSSIPHQQPPAALYNPPPSLKKQMQRAAPFVLVPESLRPTESHFESPEISDKVLGINQRDIRRWRAFRVRPHPIRTASSGRVCWNPVDAASLCFYTLSSSFLASVNFQAAPREVIYVLIRQKHIEGRENAGEVSGATERLPIARADCIVTVPP